MHAAVKVPLLHSVAVIVLGVALVCRSAYSTIHYLRYDGGSLSGEVPPFIGKRQRHGGGCHLHA